MINCNPETVSTDYDTADRLYFEPLTCEDVLEVYHAEVAAGPVAGVIVQLGGQTPLRLAQQLKDAGLPIVGTSPEAIHLAEERGAFGRVLAEADLPRPAARDGQLVRAGQGDRRRDRLPGAGPAELRARRSREWRSSTTRASLSSYIERATEVTPDHPVLVDQFLDDAVEIDVDALYDGTDLYLGGVMEHIEEAGIHSGDSACALPPITLGAEVIDRIRHSTAAIAARGRRPRLDQHPVRPGRRHALRAGGEPARLAYGAVRLQGHRDPAGQGRRAGHARRDHRRAARTRACCGRSATAADEHPGPIAVKEAVMPFNRFRTVEGISVDTILGPEMKSTGEVMGLDYTFGAAFAKSQVAGFGPLPTKGTVFISVANRDKRFVIFPVKRLADLGFEILATAGTASMLRRHGVMVTSVRKYSQGPGPNGEKTIVQAILDGEVDLIFNTPHGLSPTAGRGSTATRSVPQRCVATCRA